MPTVPFPQRQVGTAPTPDVRVSPDAPSAAFAGAVNTGIDFSGALSVAERVQAEEQQKANQVRVLDAVGKIGQLKNQLTMQLLQTRGQDAFGAQDKVQEAWQKGVSQISGTLSPAQQEMFAQHAAAEGLDLSVSVMRHVATEQRRVDDEATQTVDQNALTDAVNHAAAGDFSGVSSDIDKRVANIKLAAKRNGMPDDVANANAAAAVSSTHTAVLSQLLAAGQDKTAKAYFDKHADELLASDRIKATQAVEAGSHRAASQEHFDQIMSDPSITLTQAVQQARAIEDPDDRDLTEQRIRQEFNERAQAQREQRDATFQNATNIVEQTRDVTKVPPQIWANFTVGERESLRNYAEKLTKGTPIETDVGAYYALRQAAIGIDPRTGQYDASGGVRNKFLQTNLLQYADVLSKDKLTEMMDLQTGLRKGAQTALDTVAGLRTRNDIAKQTFDGAIAAPRGNNPDQKREHSAAWAQFNSALDARIQQLETDNGGKKAKPEDIQRLADDLVIQSATTTGQQRRVFEAQPGEQLVFSSKDVPFLERQRITKYLQARRLPVTEANILHTFVSSINNTVRPGASIVRP